MKFKTEKRKSPILYGRSMQIDRAAIGEESRTVPMSFSSETPVLTSDGFETFYEILDHSTSSIRMARAKKGLPLLKDHSRSILLGRVNNISFADKVGAGDSRFATTDEARKELELVRDETITDTSVGYRVFKRVQEGEKDGFPLMRATDWMPVEVSTVSIGADEAVGFRSDEEGPNELTIERRIHDMKKCTFCEKEHADINERGLCPICEGKRVAPPITPAPAAPEQRQAVPAPALQVDVEAVKREAKDSETKRQKDINAIGEEFKQPELARKFIDGDKTVNEFREAVLKDMGAKRAIETPTLDMDKKDMSKYRIANLILSQDPQSGIEAGLEREASMAVAKLLKRQPKGLYVPMDVISEKRDLNTTTDSEGGYTVATDLLSMIEKLENMAMVIRLGATTFNGLVGDIAIPRQTGGATAYWLTNETTAVTESTPAFDQLTLSPKTIGAYSEYTRDFLLQSTIDAENFLRSDLALRLALGLDLAAISGSGAAGQPTGILNTSGIGDVDLGVDGGPITWPNFVKLWSEVAQDNADFGSTGFLTNAKVHGHLMDVEKTADTGLFIAREFPGTDGMTNYSGSRAAVSNQVPSNLTDGDGTGLSAIIFGNWADWIIAMWGGLDILSNPYTKQTTRLVQVTAFQSTDMAARHAESFSASQDVATS